MVANSSEFTHPDKEAAKFHVDSSELVERSSSLPATYADDSLVALVRDPFNFFCFWEISPAHFQNILGRHGSDIFNRTETVLRVIEESAERTEGNGGTRSFDISVILDSKAWSGRVDQPGQAYFLKLGLRLPDSTFIELLRSNRIKMPNGKVSDETDSEWLAVQQAVTTVEWNKVLQASGLDQVGLGSSGSSRPAPERAEESHLMSQRWEFVRSVFSGSSARLSSSAPTSWHMPSSVGEKTSDE